MGKRGSKGKVAASPQVKKGRGWRRRLGPTASAGCVERGGKRVQKVQKVQRVQRVVDCHAGNAYKVSVTGLAFVSPVLLNKE